LKVLEDHTAGDSMRGDVKWTNLSRCEIARRIGELGTPVSRGVVSPYCSKYNPIEHRLFPHVTRACRGVIFRTLKTAQHYMAKARTRTGLTVTVTVKVLEKVYETGRKCAAGFKESMKIAFDKILPK
jgi:hypothetical protein